MDIYNEFINLARFSISGRKEDAITLIRRAAKKLSNQRPELESQLKDILSQSGSTGIRRAAKAPSLNAQSVESFLQTTKSSIDFEPVWSVENKSILKGIIAEHKYSHKLRSANISPTRSVLLVGPPGIGKTLTAQWLARELKRELLVLNLASIMSSLLGRTGANLSKVLETASNSESILFLDEFDSIGKSRDDVSDVGELKRLVNVLLQSLDSWEGSGLLIAATNHPDLLDKAVWRRFDQVIEFEHATAENQSVFIKRKLDSLDYSIESELKSLISKAFEGESFSDLERWINSCLRKSIVQNRKLELIFVDNIATRLRHAPTEDKVFIAEQLISTGVSQRKASELLHISRDTIRKYSDGQARRVGS